jgi:hypothetical protein
MESGGMHRSLKKLLVPSSSRGIQEAKAKSAGKDAGQLPASRRHKPWLAHAFEHQLHDFVFWLLSLVHSLCWHPSILPEREKQFHQWEDNKKLEIQKPTVVISLSFQSII